MTVMEADKSRTGDFAARALAERLKAQIEAGQLRPGERVLAERKLAQKYDVPLHTVRLALGVLKQEGAVYSRPKSGLYVADTTTSTAARSASEVWTLTKNDASVDGFSLLDSSEMMARDLHFLVGSWDRFNRGAWEQVCRTYSAAQSDVYVEPAFADGRRAYQRLRPWSDSFISTHVEVCKRSQPQTQIEPIDTDQLRSLGLESRYIEAVDDGQGQSIGVPVSAAMMIGLLNTRLIPDRLIQPLIDADSWSVVFELLTEAVSHCPGCCPLNIHSTSTFNVHQYLTIAAGGMLRGDRIDLRPAPVRRALDQLDHFLDRTDSRPAPDAGRPAQQSCLVDLDFTSSRWYPPGEGWRPWRYPLGEEGGYLEGINIGFVNRVSPHGTEACDFLLHLASVPVQRQITQSPREQTVSTDVELPAKFYSDSTWQVITDMRRRSTVFREWTPGYARMIGNVLIPLSAQWLAGNMSTQAFCDAVEDQGNQCLDAYRQETN